MSRSPGTSPDLPGSDPGGYTVVARRYRPQRFEDVVGQDHVVQALRNAIRLNRVTHAYLFSGTRGVGKTSIARIFAKCLNCAKGPTDEPDLTCDICQSIAVGQDVDVIEIDGASNNGVEAVRELRQNAGLRPSRARFKIYYIDEVHMLSTSAFNALLKTLEEPPAHVKFFFATTEPNKIPVTVLSRCQRYDFAGMSPEQIVATLGEICESERVAADPDALAVVARRAGGSMRDAQSLLEQLLSFGGERLTVELVQQQLGIASDDRTLDLLDALSKRDAAETLRIVEETSTSGVQPADLLGASIDFLRDAMVLAAGAKIPMMAATPRQRPRLAAISERWPLDSILAALQILDEYRRRLRGSAYGRQLVEVALVRIARLENLGDLGELVTRLTALEAGGIAPAPALEKKKSLVPEPPGASRPGPPESELVSEPGLEGLADPGTVAAPGFDVESLSAGWARFVEGLPPELAGKIGKLRPVAIPGPDVLIVEPIAGYNWIVDAVETAETRARFEAALREWLARPLDIRLQRAADEPAPTPLARKSGIGLSSDLDQEPLVKMIVERFEARLVRAESDDEEPPVPAPSG
ncbi:DNA polymerase III subunit gamma/tau [Tundrisphaera sp. TA3]|uniref:DNA polymerase III subunit gamma/tau n=1 Tax=Tundrisphaera sp. TA3 TaxID=3435775 RepID=UPI003EC10426